MTSITPKTPIEIPTSATVSFIESHVPSGRRILEIGCGSGHVAAKLAGLGYKVIAVDSDEKAVSQAQNRGVRVVRASWPDSDVEKVDSVVFTRSLHHMAHLPEAVSKVAEVLMPNGSVLIEDFAFDEADQAAIEWFLEVVKSRKAQALMSPGSSDFITSLLNSDDPVSAWHQEHDHDLHSASTMTQAIGEVFEVCETQRVPYLYRYLVDAVAENPHATSYVEEILSTERHLGSVGAFPLIGHRIVAAGC